MIHLSTSADEFLIIHEIYPSEWGIDASEMDEIKKCNIGLIVFNSPASTLEFDKNPILRTVREIIILDKKSIRDLTSRQIVGIILHEIGHIRNPPPPQPPRSQNGISGTNSYYAEEKPSPEELSADEYTTKLNYGLDFAEALEILNPNPSKVIRARIEQLKKDNANIHTCDSNKLH